MRVSLEQAIERLSQGDVVAIPTETVYGLAADARNENALRQVYAVKKRPANNPLIVHIAHAKQVGDWACEYPPLAEKIAEAFWPGPLTLVLAAKPNVSKTLTAGQATVALRVPNHPLTLQLLQASGLGLAAPSANQYTQLSPTTSAHVESGLGAHIAVLDGGACKVGIESTIVEVYQDTSGVWQWQLLRAGMVSEHDVSKAAGQDALTQKSKGGTQTKVPGQHLLHYSPTTPLVAFTDRHALIKQVETFQRDGVACAVLLLGDGALPDCTHRVLAKDPKAYAEQLYSALHDLDALNVAEILVELPPDDVVWIPILDRLNRAVHQ